MVVARHHDKYQDELKLSDAFAIAKYHINITTHGSSGRLAALG